MKLLLTLSLLISVAAHAQTRRPVVAVLDPGATDTARRVAERLSTSLLKQNDFRLASRAPSMAAARGAGYAGSLNLERAEARDLGAAIGCDFYLLGDAQTVQRTSSTRPRYFESYASLFIVSARTGQLVLWDLIDHEAATADAAEKSLLDELPARASRYAARISETLAVERAARFAPRDDDNAPALLDVATTDNGDDPRLRPPQPYRRLRPNYPAAAARFEIEATIDVEVEIDAAGEVGQVEIMRWAGYDLNDAVLALVRQLHFRPATRDGVAFPIRVLLRYNFRRPTKSERG